jgi:hypothetical protein
MVEVEATAVAHDRFGAKAGGRENVHFLTYDFEVGNSFWLSD